MNAMKSLRNVALAPEYRKKFIGKNVIDYMFLPETEPYCNSRCMGCYMLSSESMEKRIRKSEERIISDMKMLTARGYSVFAITTEILLAKRYLEILSTVRATSLLTNGKIIVEQPEKLDGLKQIGIRQIAITQNFESKGFSIELDGICREANRLVLDAGFSLMGRIILNSQNVRIVPNMVEKCVGQRMQTIQFLRYMPLERWGPGTPTREQTEWFFETLAGLRKEYPYDKATSEGIYLSAGLGMGTEFRQKKAVCNAGKNPVTIGLDNRVYPCIYLTQSENAIGRFEAGRIIMEREFVPPVSGADGSSGDGSASGCPAYDYFNKKQKTR